jgi:hypothetical protein
MDEVRLQEEGEPAKEMTARPPAKHVPNYTGGVVP